MGIPQDDSPKKMGFSSTMILTTLVIIEIFANGFIIWYLLIKIPADGARITAKIRGRQMCGIEFGAYAIADFSSVLILTGLYYLRKWHFSQSES